MFDIADFAGGASALFTGGTAGRVHSVYRSTVNLESRGALYALQPAGTPRTPISLTVDVLPEEFARLRLGRGDPVICGSALRVGPYLFGAERAAKWDPRLRRRGRPDGELLESLRGTLRRELVAGGRGSDFAGAALHQGIGPEASECRRLSAEGAAGFLSSAVEGRYRTAAEECAGLIGLGAGLTPAGDDFNVGVMAVLWYLDGEGPAPELRRALESEIARRCAGTTDVSREFLRAALRGEFSEPILALFEPGTAPGELAGAVRRAMAVGHTSGADMLCGMLLAAEACAGIFTGFHPFLMETTGGSQK